MRSRSLILVLALAVLAIGAVGAAQRDSDRNDKSTSAASTRSSTTDTGAATTTTQAATTTTTEATPSTTSTTTSGSNGGVEANTVTGTLPADKEIKATVGDVVELRVTSEQPDIVEVLALGLHSSVGPEIPATLTFVADGAGRFPVTYEVAGKEAGVVDVTE